MSEVVKKAELKQPVCGDHIIFHDPTGVPHEALCTTNWGACINLVVISKDEKKQDQYGRQIERFTSISHGSMNKVHGFYWRWPSEEANPYKAPISS